MTSSPHATGTPDAAAARAALDALDGLTFAPLQRDDLPELAALYAVCEETDGATERRSLSGLTEYFEAPRARPDEDVLVARDHDGDVVTVAWAGCNRSRTEVRGVFLGGAVHPRCRRRGVGRAVLTWQVAHALAWDRATREPCFGPLPVRLEAPEGQHDLRSLAERAGLVPTRWFLEMSRPADVVTVPEPRGVRLTGWAPLRSAEVHHAIDTAFSDHWGHAPQTDEMWAEYTGSNDFRADLCLLALDTDTDEVVGAALNCTYEQDWAATGTTEGYTDMLGVLASHRGRGVARALLAASVTRFAGQGLERAALGVDVANPSGALGLYRSLGYTPRATTVVHELLLGDGAAG